MIFVVMRNSYRTFLFRGVTLSLALVPSLARAAVAACYEMARPVGAAPVAQSGGVPWGVAALLAAVVLLVTAWVGHRMARMSRSLTATRSALAERIAEATRRLEAKNAELAAANEELHHANRELEQQRALVERSARFAALGEMAAGLAHEINNPLTTMKNLIHSLRPTMPDEDIRGRDLAVVAEEIEKLNRLVVNFLKYARPPKVNIRPMDVADLVESTIKLLEPQAHQKELTILSSVDVELPLVLADREQLGQVLVNLVLNAIQASPEGGEVRIAASVEVAAEQGKPRAVQISVSDQGPGVSEQSRAKVFNPFFTTKADGSGLGLAISQRIVEEHGGTLTLSSVFGQGATFVVSLSRFQESYDEPDSDRR